MTTKISLIDTTAAAEYLGIKSNTLEIWRVRSEGPRYIKLGRLVRYRIEDINMWIEAQTHQSSSGYGKSAPKKNLAIPKIPKIGDENDWEDTCT